MSARYCSFVRGLSSELSKGRATDARTASLDIDALVADGRFGHPETALHLLETYLPALEQGPDPQELLHGLAGRAELLRLSGASPSELMSACDMLERAAQEQRGPVWAAVALAMQARAHLDASDVRSAMADLGRVELDHGSDTLAGPGGYQLFEVLAEVYTRLRLHNRVDEARQRIEDAAQSRGPVARATHWTAWATELACRAMDPIARGATEPDHRLLDRAADLAGRLDRLDQAALPARLIRTAAGVRALAAAYRGRGSESLRLLARDAFAEPRDLTAMERQVVTMAAMHAHALLGSVATARSLDEAATRHTDGLPDLVLEVARARERLWLETHAGGDVVPVLHRLTELLVRLGWQGMDLVADTARQALEHQSLRAETRTDALTGVGSRRALDDELRHMLRFSPLPMSLLLVDVNDFTRLNDQFTTAMGDEVLRRVATALSQQLRAGDRILRYGGDEFVVLLPRSGDQEARQVADRMSRAIARLPWSELADGLRVGISTGFAALSSLTGRRPEPDAERLFRQAEESLLQAKRDRSPMADPAEPAEPAEPEAVSTEVEPAAEPDPAAAEPEPAAAEPEPAAAEPEPVAAEVSGGEPTDAETTGPIVRSERRARRVAGPIAPEAAAGSEGSAPTAPAWTGSPMEPDLMASRAELDRALAPPPEPGRTQGWRHRRPDPLTDPEWVDAGLTGSLMLASLIPTPADAEPEAASEADAKAGPEPEAESETEPESESRAEPVAPAGPIRARRRPAVIDLGGDPNSTTPFG